MRYFIPCILINLIAISSCINQDKAGTFTVEGEWNVVKLTMSQQTLPKAMSSKYNFHFMEGGTYNAFFLDVTESGKWQIDGTGTTIILNPINPPLEPVKNFIIKELTENTLSIVWWTGGEDISVILKRKAQKKGT